MSHLDQNLQRERYLPEERIGLPAIYNASTVYFTSHEQYKGDQSERLGYGREGNPTQYALKRKIIEREQGFGALLYASGLLAISSTITALVKRGSKLLVADHCYEPSIEFCRKLAEQFELQLTIFDATDLAVFEQYCQQGYDLMLMEVMASNSLAVCDIAAIAKLCQKYQVCSVIDATWSAGITAKPLTLGFDVVVHSCTKFFSGCSDVFLGVVVANQSVFTRLAGYAELTGNHVSSQDVYYILRGLKTLDLRYQHQSILAHKLALSLCEFFACSPIIDAQVNYPTFHPAFHQGSGFCQPEFGGSLVVFSFNWQQGFDFGRFFSKLRLIKCGYSWGGADSLVTYGLRGTATGQRAEFRVHMGSEQPEQIYQELEQALQALMEE
ncbi:trans-sulfuration enzyme family protein [Enterovibrio norvegicus]|uniref:trans-sulfuration enzyme family protein n=1 Tax=Enterovibrio norvegicus TaxID=188144 RepID=UPI0024B0F80F|nr:PLP-dependent transferase [Enterovibrio norvegicus]